GEGFRTNSIRLDTNTVQLSNSCFTQINRGEHVMTEFNLHPPITIMPVLLDNIPVRGFPNIASRSLEITSADPAGVIRSRCDHTEASISSTLGRDDSTRHFTAARARSGRQQRSDVGLLGVVEIAPHIQRRS